MPDPKIAQKAPYIMDEEPGEKWWCACGHSQNQPYCDGSHKELGGGITPIRVEITEAKKVPWCGCKHSAKKPYCDGSHRDLS
ncbi:MAG: CDGSH iron-sulfur domain-containing protein [Myxococcota bacterium]